jgi:hypothetical protein
MSEKENPLILVFYIDREMITDTQLINPFVESVNHMIETKGANMMAFFLPTDGEERIECLNPKLIHEPEMEKITQIISDIKEACSVGVDIDVPDEEITLDENQCGCGGDCQCTKTQE